MTLSLDVLLSIEMRDAYCLAPRISFTIHHLFDCNNKENRSTYLSFVAAATWKKYADMHECTGGRAGADSRFSDGGHVEGKCEEYNIHTPMYLHSYTLLHATTLIGTASGATKGVTPRGN